MASVYDVSGYVPQDAGFALCLRCHDTRCHFERVCDCAPIFPGEETDSAVACDHCSEEIETTVIGESNHCRSCGRDMGEDDSGECDRCASED